MAWIAQNQEGMLPSPVPSTTLPRVLLVDDDTRTAKLLAHMLREDGFVVELARDGAAAIGRLTRSPMPDVLVTDLNLPNVDGVAVTLFARAQEPNLPVVIVTGHPNMAVSMNATLTPVPVVFTKPLEYERLAQELRKVTPARTEPAAR